MRTPVSSENRLASRQMRANESTVMSAVADMPPSDALRSPTQGRLSKPVEMLGRNGRIPVLCSARQWDRLAAAMSA